MHLTMRASFISFGYMGDDARCGIKNDNDDDDDQCGDDEVYNIFANTQNVVAPHTTSLHRTI